MSAQAMGWVLNQDIRPSSMKFVLLALADGLLAADGEIFMSVKDICRQTSQCPATVLSALSKLRERGYIAALIQQRLEQNAGWGA